MSGFEKYVEQAAEVLAPHVQVWRIWDHEERAVCLGCDWTSETEGHELSAAWALHMARLAIPMVGPLIEEDTRDRMVTAAGRALEREAPVADAAIPPEAPKHDCVGDENYGCPACIAEGASERTWQVPAAASPKWADLFGIDPDYGDTTDEAETKALAETATRLGRELGRREAAEEIAAAFDREAELIESLPDDDGVRPQVRDILRARRAAFRDSAHIAREIATKATTS